LVCQLTNNKFNKCFKAIKETITLTMCHQWQWVNIEMLRTLKWRRREIPKSQLMNQAYYRIHNQKKHILLLTTLKAMKSFKTLKMFILMLICLTDQELKTFVLTIPWILQIKVQTFTSWNQSKEITWTIKNLLSLSKIAKKPFHQSFITLHPLYLSSKHYNPYLKRERNQRLGLTLEQSLALFSTQLTCHCQQSKNRT